MLVFCKFLPLFVYDPGDLGIISLQFLLFLICTCLIPFYFNFLSIRVKKWWIRPCSYTSWLPRFELHHHPFPPFVFVDILLNAVHDLIQLKSIGRCSLLILHFSHSMMEQLLLYSLPPLLSCSIPGSGINIHMVGFNFEFGSIMYVDLELWWIHSCSAKRRCKLADLFDFTRGNKAALCC